MAQKKNLNVFELAKQFHCPVSVVKRRIESLEQGQLTAYKRDPAKLSQEEFRELIKIVSSPDHPSAEELSKKFGKPITSQLIRKAKHPLWSPDDNERLGKLFAENGAEKSLNWYQQ